MIESICLVVTSLSTVFIALQLLLSKITEKKHHEEMRRVKTVEVMENWSNSLKKETSFAEKIVEGFTEPQCRSLYFKQPLELDVKKGKNICQICTECDGKKETCQKCISDNKFKLEGVPLSEFRWYVIGYLNMLETVMTAWRLRIVDTDEIENQFQYLYNPEQGWNALEAFRTAAGGEDAYPNIAKFMQTLELKKKQKNNRSKKPL